jgi:hypothetical protein
MIVSGFFQQIFDRITIESVRDALGHAPSRAGAGVRVSERVSMSEFHQDRQDVRPARSRQATLEIEDSVVVLFHVGGRFYCLDDVCTHDGGPLGEGRLCGHAIACPGTGPSSTSAPAKLDCKIDMTMTSPMCPAGPQMIQNSKQVLGQLAGMGNVEVKIVLDPPWTPDKMTQEARDALGIF